MNTGYTIAEETRIAEEIVSVLPAGSVARLISDERDSIRFVVQSGALKLRTIVFSRASLARLANDPARGVKIEYLQRDLSQSATRRCEFRYPRPIRILTAIRGQRRMRAASLAVAMV
ncbi:MAG: hypothetical protein JJE51_07285 [Thermoanaerobaculia bacterium]|nr:hypothetical protein [Thermoanaerobaculia bacterium]